MKTFSGAFVSISLFSRRLKWNDAVLGFISNLSKIMGSLATGFARNGTEMYIGVYFICFFCSSSLVFISYVSFSDLNNSSRKLLYKVPDIITASLAVIKFVVEINSIINFNSIFSCCNRNF